MPPEHHRERRVQCVFAVTFMNGGSIQDQGFRLDIAGDDISDEALTDALVRDLRLLMVSAVQIHSKQIIVEPHKRPAPALDRVEGKASDAAGQRRTARHLIDLSHTVEDGLITYKGLPAPVVCDYLSREQSHEHY